MSDIVTRARELLAGITPGPWIAEYSGEQGNCVIPADAQSTREAVCVTRLYHQQADAEFIAAAPQLVTELADRIESAESLLRALVDADDCWFDHNGDCQAHGFFDGPCAHEQAKQFLGMKEADRG